MNSLLMPPKKALLYLAVAANMLMLSACAVDPFQLIPGPSNVVTQEIDIVDFDKVDIGDAFTAQIRQGDTFQVEIEVDEASLPYLQVNQRGDTLEIGMQRRRRTFWITNPVLRAEVTMPTLVEIHAEGASHVDVNGFRTDEDVYIDVSGASLLRGEMDTGNTRFNITGSSDVDLSGTRGDLEAEVTGASNFTLRGEGQNAVLRAAGASEISLAEFPIQDATVEADGASDVTVDVAGMLNAEADGASTIRYHGDPTLGDLDTSGNSTIEEAR